MAWDVKTTIDHHLDHHDHRQGHRHSHRHNHVHGHQHDHHYDHNHVHVHVIVAIITIVTMTIVTTINMIITLMTILREFGQPLSYLRVHHANLLEMTIPPRSKRGETNKHYFLTLVHSFPPSHFVIIVLCILVSEKFEIVSNILNACCKLVDDIGKS